MRSIILMVCLSLEIFALNLSEWLDSTGIDTIKLLNYEEETLFITKDLGIEPYPIIDGPSGICVNKENKVYILDNVKKRIVIFSNKGEILKEIHLKNFNWRFVGTEGSLLMDEFSNFYIISWNSYEYDNLCHFKYDSLGNKIGEKLSIPFKGLNVKLENIKMIKEKEDTRNNRVRIFSFEVNCLHNKLDIPIYIPSGFKILEKRILGVDSIGNIYFHVSINKLYSSTLSYDKAEKQIERAHIIYKYNHKYNLRGIIFKSIKNVGGIEIVTLGGDGNLYMMCYGWSFRCGDIPDWVKEDKNMPEEEKEKWREPIWEPTPVKIIKYSFKEE